MSHHRARLAVVAVLGVSVALASHLGAMFVMSDTEQVPIERLLANLERRAQANPTDIDTRLDLARLHAMAYATKTETGSVRKAVPGQPAPPPDEPFFGVLSSQFGSIRVTATADSAKLAAAKAHLTKAIEIYDSVIALDPNHIIARLGRAWCLDQAGDRARAIDGYRDVLNRAWAKENAGDLPGLQNFEPLTTEVGGYLLALLDPTKDAGEITTVRQKMAKISQDMRRRPITPIVIPLTDRAEAASLVDRSARVAFDADGSGLAKRWTWITPDAGWLVYDAHDTRRVSSALQMFGGVTFWLFWGNGYRALDALDDNGDGDLRGAELAHLAIWQDRNRDGVADPGEVRPLREWGIVSVSCAFEWMDDPDVVAMSRAGVKFTNGAARPTYDVLLYPK